MEQYPKKLPPQVDSRLRHSILEMPVEIRKASGYPITSAAQVQADKNAENVQIVRFSSAKVDFFGFCPEKSACYIDETGKKRYNKCMCAHAE